LNNPQSNIDDAFEVEGEKEMIFKRLMLGISGFNGRIKN